MLQSDGSQDNSDTNLPADATVASDAPSHEVYARVSRGDVVMSLLHGVLEVGDASPCSPSYR